MSGPGASENRKVGIVRFPGTNCDYDIQQMCNSLDFKSDFLWYQNRFEIADYEMLILPGGFSFGDYLRCGALAARSPVMDSVREFALAGKPILGICNGFQILCESGLLPGVLLQNQNGQFIDRWCDLKLVHRNPFFAKSSPAQMTLPIAHGDGRFFIDSDGLKKIQDQNQIWLQYSENPNGSVFDIAGVMNEKKNVCALMPHPERAIFEWMGQGSFGKDFLI